LERDAGRGREGRGWEGEIIVVVACDLMTWTPRTLSRHVLYTIGTCRCDYNQKNPDVINKELDREGRGSTGTILA